ncbi:hypothetical protein [Emcibacter sp.]|uniref:hypothetical protein n=1 Tax=Emcibacter sp. TaxID=1979954 RepID=UPI002AA76BAB|nr:hypothetical protein [Emcibacter sp.]
MNLSHKLKSAPYLRALVAATVVVASLSLQSCGKRSALEPPPGYQTTDQPAAQEQGE